MTGLMTVLVYGDLPVNGGLWRPITVELGEPGTIVNSVPPAPVSNAHSEVGMRACKLAKAVLNQALSLSDDATLRGRVAGQCQDGFPGSALFGANQHGGTSVIFYVDNASGSGGGAQTVGDGQDSYGLTCMTGCGLADVEVHEAADPVMFLWRKLIANSGGPGQTRGGQALEQAFALHFSDAMGGPGFNACAEVPPIGFGGGYPASSGDFKPLANTNIAALIDQGLLPTEARLQGTPLPTRSKMTHLVLSRDDVFVTTSGGGGGLGDPLLRDRALVAADLAAGYITPAHAREIYGIVLDNDGAIDERASQEQRELIRRRRIGGTPTAELRAPASIGVAIVRDGDDWACGSCGARLQAVAGNWREGAVALVETPITERYGPLEMNVRPRREEPDVTVREYACRACAASLAVEVVAAGLEPVPAPRLLAEAAVAD
jgi:N-methylhydantoinase B